MDIRPSQEWLYSEHSFFVFRNIIEQVADHVMVTDKHGFIEYVNPAFEKTTLYTKAEVLGKNPRILQSGKQPLEYYQELWRTILAGKVFHAKPINKKKNGEFFVADQTISPIFNEFKEITHFVSIWKDATETARIDERIKLEKEKLEEIISFDEQLTHIRKSDQLIDFVVDKTRKILQVNKCSVMLVDGGTDQIYTKAMEGFDENVPMQINISGSIAQKAIVTGQPLLVNDLSADPLSKDLKQESFLGNAFMIAPIRLGQQVIGIINVADKKRDVHERGYFEALDIKILTAIATEMAVAIENVSFHKELHYLKVIDPLTQLHNYRHFTNSLDYEFKRLKRFPGELALLIIDIDGFKAYNDHLGQLQGDELLRKMAQLLRSNLREVDVLCRYGGDEFVIILPGTNKEGAVMVAEKIRKCMASAKFPKDVTLSVGVAQYKEKMTRHELTSKADSAIFQAKGQGKNRICVY